MADLESLSVDELEAAKDKLHREEEAIREKLLAAKAVLDRKLAFERARQALQQAGMDMNADGSVLITPPGAVMGVEPGEVN
jgi:hypothetical protein